MKLTIINLHQVHQVHQVSKMTSIYVPRVGMAVSAQIVADVFSTAGVVSDVEFVRFNVLPGIFQNDYKSAIIYFDTINPEDNLWTIISTDGVFLIEMTPLEHWVCLVNFNRDHTADNKYTTELEKMAELQSTAISTQSDVIRKQQQIIDELTKPTKAVVSADREMFDDDLPEFIECSLQTEQFDFYMEY